jgi:hypothetical protein
MSEERKQRQLQQLGNKESTFLRLRRTKLGLDDFRTVKVIGKGAFGEASVETCQLRVFDGWSILIGDGRFAWFRRLIPEKSML